MINQYVVQHFSTAMRQACLESRRWIGATSPNPPVGAAALDEKGEVLAVAAHQRAGDNHAEAALLKLCRDRNLLAQMHTLCVTLEPCNHQGRTPPCSETIIQAGIRRVVIGIKDPNPYVAGGGAARLREAGIEVIEGVESDLCAQSMHAFLYQAQTGLPFVTVKRAFDGQSSMIPPVGQKTFTSPESLILAHRLRKKADAIVTGNGTILSDNPLFNVRHVKDHEGKRRILAILDRRERVSEEYMKAAAERGLDVVIYRDIGTCFDDLKKRGMQDILVEAGPMLSQSVLESAFWTMKVDIHQGSVDRIEVGFCPNAELPFNANGLNVDALVPI